MPTLYDILEVTPEASPEVIRVAYRSLAAKYHPDRGTSGELFKLVADAYETLSNPQKRAAYDAMMAASNRKIHASDTFRNRAVGSPENVSARSSSVGGELLSGLGWSVRVSDIIGVRIKQTPVGIAFIVAGVLVFVADITIFHSPYDIVGILLGLGCAFLADIQNACVVSTPTGDYVYRTGNTIKVHQAMGEIKELMAKSKV